MMNSEPPTKVSELPRHLRKKLSDYYEGKKKHPNQKERIALANEVGLDLPKITEWFSNKRGDEKRKGKGKSVDGKPPTKVSELPRHLRKILSDFYEKEKKHPNKEEKIALANAVGLDLQKISNWFKNKRSNEKKRKGKSSGPVDEKIKPAQEKEKNSQKPPITKGEQSTIKRADLEEKLGTIHSLSTSVRDIRDRWRNIRAEISLTKRECQEVADIYKKELRKALDEMCVQAEEAQKATNEFNESCREADNKRLKIAELMKEEKELREQVKEKKQLTNQKKVTWATTPISRTKMSFKPKTGDTRKWTPSQPSKWATPATKTKLPQSKPKNGDTTKRKAGMRGQTEPIKWASLSRTKMSQSKLKSGDCKSDEPFELEGKGADDTTF